MWKDLTFKERAALINKWTKEGNLDYGRLKREYDEAHKYDDGGSINPMNYEYRGTLYSDELKNQGITHVADLPEVVVRGQRRRPYVSSNALNPENVWNSIVPNNAEKLYGTVDPNGGYHPWDAIWDYYIAHNHNRKPMIQELGADYLNSDNANNLMNQTEAAFATYLGLDDSVFQSKSTRKNDKISNYLLPADYFPTSGTHHPNVYKLAYPESNLNAEGDYTIPFLNDYVFAQMVERKKGKPNNTVSTKLRDAGVPTDTIYGGLSNLGLEGVVFGTHGGNTTTGEDYTIGFGLDPKGPYLSYYDEYDLNAGIFGDHKTGDIGLPISHPFSIYDRKYYTKEDSTKIMDAYHKYGEKAFDKTGKLKIK